MFRNYVRNPVLASPVNLAAARTLLGGYLLWKIVSIDWHAVVEWPVYPYRNYAFPYPNYEVFAVDIGLAALPFLQWVVVVGLLCFVAGYRLRLVTFVTALVLSYMAAVLLLLQWSGNTEAFFMCAFILLFFGLYAEQDALSIDGLRRTRTSTLDELNELLRSTDRPTYRADSLRWSLLVVAVLYFGSGFSKIVHGPGNQWVTAASLGRHVRSSHYRLGIDPVLGRWFLEAPDLVVSLAALSTLVLETGLLVAAIAGLSIAPVVVALLGFHTVIALVQGPIFVDMIIVLLLFAAFDRGYARLASDREVDLVYDDRCYACARSLYPFKLLDINERVAFYSRYDPPDEYADRDDVNFEEEVYAFVGDEAYGGYWAIRELFRQFWATIPLAWVMGLPPVAAVGERAYEHVAANRDRYFASGYEPTDRV